MSLVLFDYLYTSQPKIMKSDCVETCLYC